MRRIVIPPMTNDLAHLWDQPPLEDIWFFDGLAIMMQRTFKSLKEYSSTMPSGVYDGKMWKCQTVEDEWILRWFEPSEDPKKCVVRWCPIVVVEIKENADGCVLSH